MCCCVCLWSPEDVALNPVTAYPFLILSSDRKQVKRGETLQFFRSNPQRYDVWSCVLAKEGYATGRHYWEVRARRYGNIGTLTFLYPCRLPVPRVFACPLPGLLLW